MPIRRIGAFGRSRAGLVVAGLVLFHAATAMGQAGGSAVVDPGIRQPAGTGGVMVGDGVYLKVGVTAEAGYDTNVFYDDRRRVDSGTLQVTPFAELNNTTREGASPPLHYSIGASLLYREYLNDDSQVRAQRAFNPAFSGTLAYSSGGQTVALSDQFVRMQDAPYQPESAPITRDMNIGIVQATISPGGGRITITPRYTNTLDLFEGDELSYGNRMAHDGMIDGSWKWLPKTALFLQAGIGYVQYLNDRADANGKSNSIPYRFLTGIRGLITPKLSLNVGAGFSDALYDQETANPTGLSNLYATAGLNFNATEMTALGASYTHEFRDSPILGSYYDLDAADLGITQKVGPLQLSAGGRYEYRRYHGTYMAAELSRNDHIFQTRIQVDYQLQRWFYAGVSYSNLISRSSDRMSASALGVSEADYSKHVILGRLGVTY